MLTHMADTNQKNIWLVSACILLVIATYSQSIFFLTNFWMNSEEYSHGLIIPFVIGYIVWTDRGKIFDSELVGNSLGLVGIIISQLLHFAAILADLESVKLYSLIICLASLALFVGNWRLLIKLSFPLTLLFLSIPLPNLLNTLLTAKMQLISSNIGVWFIRLMGLPVLQTGNVIDMGNFKMLVAEACSGLRYMYPLISIGFIFGYLFKSPMWAKIIIVISTVPITILMNSIRIAITGWIIKEFGSEAAEGFLHDFEGWVVFMAAFVLLILFAWFLSFLIPGDESFTKRLQPRQYEAPRYIVNLSKPKSISAICVLVASLGFAGFLSASRDTVKPPREPFSAFPFVVGNYSLSPGFLSSEVLNVLKADDYFLGDYRAENTLPVNLYMVYYESQQDGSALHSPRDCLPGGGWEIKSLDVKYVEQIGGKANRAIITKHDQELLVYYWIRQQGDNFANEFVARASLLWASIEKNRTDGALIRLIVPVNEAGIEEAEATASDFISLISGQLSQYLPD